MEDEIEYFDCEHCNGRGDFGSWYCEEERRVVLNLCGECSGRGTLRRWIHWA